MIDSEDRPSLLLRRGGQGSFAEPEASGYANEADLQKILADHPTLLPGIDEAAVACREFQSGVGPADVVVLHGEGDLTLIECKLAQNPQLRREVVGQVIDYASRLWKMRVGEFEARWTQRAGSSPFDMFGEAGAGMRETLAANLAAGRFTVALAVDGINQDLRRMIEQLNVVTLPQVQVLAFELARVRDQDLEILLPRVYGTELARAKAPQGSPENWTEADFFGWLEEHQPGLAPTVRQFVDEAVRRGREVVNGTAKSPSIILGLTIGEAPFLALSLFTAGPHALKLRFRLERFDDLHVDARAAAELLAQVPGQPLDLPALATTNYRKWIHVAFERLADPHTRTLILDAIDTARTAPPR